MALILQKPDSSYQFYESNFRRMENDIQTVMDAFPSEIRFDLSLDERSPTTWVNNFRHSCQAFCHPDCTWISTKLNSARIKAVFESGLRFVPDNAAKTVIVSPKKLLTIKAGTSSTVTISGVIDVRNKEPYLRAILLLKNADIIRDVTCVWGIKPEELQSLEAQYPNIAFSPAPDGTVNLI